MVETCCYSKRQRIVLGEFLLMKYQVHVHNNDYSNNLLVDFSEKQFKQVDESDFFVLDHTVKKIYYIWEVHFSQRFLDGELSIKEVLNLDQEKIRLLSLNSAYIIFDISTGTIPTNIYNRFFEFIEETNLDCNHIFILVNTVYEYNVFNSLCRNKESPNIVYTGRNELLLVLDTLSIKKQKRFLFLSRRWTVERFFIFLDLGSRGLLDNSIYSFNLTQDPYKGHDFPNVTMENISAWLSEFVEKHNKNIYSNNIIDYWESNKNEIMSSLPVFLGNNIYDQHSIEVANEFNNTYMSLCVETSINETEFRFQPSEKIYKCCYYRHPFLVYSTPKFLQKWNESGYKSFSPYFDETYDNYTNVIDRIKLINDQVEYLNKIPLKEFRTFLFNLNGILNHNQELITKKFESLTNKNFSNKMSIDELFSKKLLYYDWENQQ